MLKHCQLIIDYVKDLGKELVWHGRQVGEGAHYCNNCEIEVFNLLFVIEQEKKHVVHCLDCARKINPRLEAVTVLHQFKMEELMSLYDNFQLGTVVSTENMCVFIS